MYKQQPRVHILHVNPHVHSAHSLGSLVSKQNVWVWLYTSCCLHHAGCISVRVWHLNLRLAELNQLSVLILCVPDSNKLCTVVCVNRSMVNRAMSWTPTRSLSGRRVVNSATVQINGVLHTKLEVEVRFSHDHQVSWQHAHLVLSWVGPSSAVVLLRNEATIHLL